MILADYEIPVAYSMLAMAAQTPERRPDIIPQFMCYWVAFNNIYVTIAERAGKQPQLRRNSDGSIQTCSTGDISVPKVTPVREREQLDLAFLEFTENLKRRIVEHQSARFFVDRTPCWKGQRIEYDSGGQRLNGVLNVGYTVDALYPVWTPVDTVEFTAYHDGGDTEQRCNLLAKQILNVLYTVRNNIFHGGKRVDDANDNKVLAKALPLLAMIVMSFVQAEGTDFMSNSLWQD